MCDASAAGGDFAGEEATHAGAEQQEWAAVVLRGEEVDEEADPVPVGHGGGVR